MQCSVTYTGTITCQYLRDSQTAAENARAQSPASVKSLDQSQVKSHKIFYGRSASLPFHSITPSLTSSQLSLSCNVRRYHALWYYTTHDTKSHSQLRSSRPSTLQARPDVRAFEVPLWLNVEALCLVPALCKTYHRYTSGILVVLHDSLVQPRLHGGILGDDSLSSHRAQHIAAKRGLRTTLSTTSHVS